MNNKIQYQIDVTSDTSKASSNIEKLKKQIDSLSLKNLSSGSFISVEDYEASVNYQKSINSLLPRLNEMANILNRTTLSNGTVSAQRFTAELLRSNTNVKQLSSSLFNLQGGTEILDNLALQFSKITRESNIFGESLSKAWNFLSKSFSYQISSRLLSGITTAFSNAISFTEEFSQKLTDISVVSNITGKDLSSLGQNFQEVAKDLKVSSMDVADATLIFLQQGYNEIEAIERGTIAIKAASAAGVEMAEVSKELTALWNIFDLTGRELEASTGVLLKLGAETASSFEDIATAFQIAAPSAKALGLTYQELAAFIATVGSATQQSATVVGSATRTIFSRLSGVEITDTGEEIEVSTTLIGKKIEQAAGISILDEETGKLKEVSTILDQIASKWVTMEREQKQATALAIGGLQRQPQIISFFDDYQSYLEFLGKVEGETGQTLDESAEKYQESMQAAKEAMETASLELFEIFVNEDTIKGFYKTITTIMELVDKLIGSFGGLEGLILTLGGLFSKQIGDTFGKGLANIIGMLPKLHNKRFEEFLSDIERVQKASTLKLEAPSRPETINPLKGADLITRRKDLDTNRAEFISKNINEDNFQQITSSTSQEYLAQRDALIAAELQFKRFDETFKRGTEEEIRALNVLIDELNEESGILEDNQFATLNAIPPELNLGQQTLVEQEIVFVDDRLEAAKRDLSGYLEVNQQVYDKIQQINAAPFEGHGYEEITKEIQVREQLIRSLNDEILSTEGLEEQISQLTTQRELLEKVSSGDLDILKGLSEQELDNLSITLKEIVDEFGLISDETSTSQSDSFIIQRNDELIRIYQEQIDLIEQRNQLEDQLGGGIKGMTDETLTQRANISSYSSSERQDIISQAEKGSSFEIMAKGAYSTQDTQKVYNDYLKDYQKLQKEIQQIFKKGNKEEIAEVTKKYKAFDAELLNYKKTIDSFAKSTKNISDPLSDFAKQAPKELKSALSSISQLGQIVIESPENGMKMIQDIVADIGLTTDELENIASLLDTTVDDLGFNTVGEVAETLNSLDLTKLGIPEEAQVGIQTFSKRLKESVDGTLDLNTAQKQLKGTLESNRTSFTDIVSSIVQMNVQALNMGNAIGNLSSVFIKLGSGTADIDSLFQSLTSALTGVLQGLTFFPQVISAASAGLAALRAGITATNVAIAASGIGAIIALAAMAATAVVGIVKAIAGAQKEAMEEANGAQKEARETFETLSEVANEWQDIREQLAEGEEEAVIMQNMKLLSEYSGKNLIYLQEQWEATGKSVKAYSALVASVTQEQAVSAYDNATTATKATLKALGKVGFTSTGGSFWADDGQIDLYDFARKAANEQAFLETIATARGKSVGEFHAKDEGYLRILYDQIQAEDEAYAALTLSRLNLASDTDGSITKLEEALKSGTLSESQIKFIEETDIGLLSGAVKEYRELLDMQNAAMKSGIEGASLYDEEFQKLLEHGFSFSEALEIVYEQNERATKITESGLQSMSAEAKAAYSNYQKLEEIDLSKILPEDAVEIMSEVRDSLSEDVLANFGGGVGPGLEKFRDIWLNGTDEVRQMFVDLGKEQALQTTIAAMESQEVLTDTERYALANNKNALKELQKQTAKSAQNIGKNIDEISEKVAEEAYIYLKNGEEIDYENEVISQGLDDIVSELSAMGNTSLAPLLQQLKNGEITLGDFERAARLAKAEVMALADPRFLVAAKIANSLQVRQAAGEALSAREAEQLAGSLKYLGETESTTTQSLATKKPSGDGGGSGSVFDPAEVEKITDAYTDWNEQIRIGNNLLELTEKRYSKLVGLAKEKAGKELLNLIEANNKLLDQGLEIDISESQKARQEFEDIIKQYTDAELQVDVENLEQGIVAYGNLHEVMQQVAEATTAEYNNSKGEIDNRNKVQDIFNKLLETQEKTLSSILDKEQRETDLLARQLEMIQLRAKEQKRYYDITTVQLQKNLRYYQLLEKYDPRYQIDVLGTNWQLNANNPINKSVAYFKQYEDLMAQWTGTAAEYDVLQSIVSELGSDAQSVIGWMDDMLSQYETAFNKMGTVTDRLSGKINRLSSKAQSYQDIISLLGQQISKFNTLLEYQNSEFEINRYNIQTEISQLQLLEAEYAATQNSYMNAVDGLQKDYYAQQLEMLEDSIHDTEDALLTSFQDTIQSALDIYTSQTEEAYRRLVNFLNFGVDDDFYSTVLNMQNQIEDFTLSQSNSFFEADQLGDEISQVLKGQNLTLKQRQRLEELLAEQNQKEVDIRENGLKLTQYDVDLARARFDLIQAQAAFEDARDAKTSMKLMRDQSGNYSYVYAADQDAVDDAGRGVEEAMNRIRNLMEDQQNAIADGEFELNKWYAQESKAIKDLHAQGLISTEEMYKRELALRNQFDQMMALYEQGRTQVVRDYSSVREDLYDQEALALDYIQEVLREGAVTYEETTRANVQQLLTGSKAHQDFRDVIRQVMREIDGYYNDYQMKVEAVTQQVSGHIDISGQHALQLSDQALTVVSSMNNALTTFSNLLNTVRINVEEAFRQWLGPMQAWLDKINEIIAAASQLSALDTGAPTGMSGQAVTGGPDWATKIFNLQTYGDTSYGDLQQLIQARANSSAYGENVNNDVLLAAINSGKAYMGPNNTLYVDGKPLIPSNYPTVASVNAAGNSRSGATSSTSTTQTSSNNSSSTAPANATQNQYGFTSIDTDYIASQQAANKPKETASSVAAKLNPTIRTNLSNQYSTGELLDIFAKVAEYINTGINSSRSSIIENIAAMIGYDTGGFVIGDQIAKLHDKEIVLNKVDTSNLLKTIEMVRDIVRETTPNVQIPELTNRLVNENQQPTVVNINADFPNVSARAEIEAAFSNLANQAAQYISAKKF